MAVAGAAALPILRILANNVEENLSVARLGGWFLIFLLVGLILFWAAAKADPPGSQRLQATVIVGLLAALLYGVTLSRAFHAVEPWPKVGLTVALVITAWLLARWMGVQRFLMILPVFLLVAPGVDLVTTIARADSESARPTSEIDLPPLPDGAQRNVYWFILDGYGRWDVLRAMGGEFDLGAQLAGLGFQVDQKAVSPYEYTDLSVGATLTTEYLPQLPTFDALRSYARPILEGEPPVLGWFAGEGYRHLHLPGAGWPDWMCGQPRSICLVDSPIHLEDDMVRTITMLGTVLDLVDGDKEDREAKRVDPVLATRASLRIQRDSTERRPTLSVIHVMSSHPSYRWLGPTCEPQPARMLSDQWLPAGNYLDAVRCTGQRALEAVRLVVEEDPEAVVIVQGDHGPRLQEGSWDAFNSDISIDTVWMGVHLAMRLPDGCRLDEGNSTVNIFRIVIGCMSGEEIARLPSRSWHMDQENPDSTDRLPVLVSPDHG